MDNHGRLPWHQEIPCDCDKCTTLWELIRLTKTGKRTLTFTNVKLRTDIEGAVYVLAIDGQGSPGMQRAIGVDGMVKCIICDEVTNTKPVCERCFLAVEFIRSLQRKMTVPGLQDFSNRLEQLDEAGMLGLLNLVTLEALKEWWRDQIKEIDVEGI